MPKLFFLIDNDLKTYKAFNIFYKKDLTNNLLILLYLIKFFLLNIQQ